MDKEQAKAELLTQTAKISWPELERYFAAGKLIYVADSLDLIEVGSALIDDDTAAFSEWTQSGKVKPVDDNQAKLFVETSPTLWATVVAPWVLVQIRNSANTAK